MTSPGVELLREHQGALPTRLTTQRLGTTAWTLSSATTDLTYDPSFRVTRELLTVTTPASTSDSAFAYDADDLVTCAQLGASTCNPSASTAFVATYRPDNALPDTTRLGAVTDTFAFNSHGELSTYAASVSGSPLYAEVVDSLPAPRDLAGRITTRTETVAGVTTATSYAYDALGRLTTVTQDGAPLRSFTYDANGNRTGVTEAGVTTTATYDAQDRLLTYGSAGYAYTASGDLHARTDATGTTTYDYDLLGRLQSVTLPSGQTVSYLHDPLGRRVARKLGATQTARWVYGDDGRLVAELDGAGNLRSRFLYAGGRVPVAMARGSSLYRIVADHLGSVRLVVDTATGVVAERVDYDEWGRVTSDTQAGFQPFGFAGGIYDDATGLVRFGVRDYDAATGRWTAKDPVRFEGGQANLYLYVGGDPVNLIDPSGLLNPTKLCAAAASGANAGRLAAGGALKLAAAAGVGGTGVGSGPAALLAAYGVWNLRSASVAWRAAMQLTREAMTERWEDANARNLLGALPFGTRYDDPGEPTPWDLAHQAWDDYKGKPGEFLDEIGKLF